MGGDRPKRADKMPDLPQFLLDRFAEDLEAIETSHGEGWFLRRRRRRLLADCAAKTSIVRYAIEQQISRGDRRVLATLDLVLRHLAIPYADHPDYREEWRPDDRPGLQWGPPADYGEG